MSDSKETGVDGDDVNWHVVFPSTSAQYFHLLRQGRTDFLISVIILYYIIFDCPIPFPLQETDAAGLPKASRRRRSKDPTQTERRLLGTRRNGDGESLSASDHQVEAHSCTLLVY
jgi:hypothetical protein